MDELSVCELGVHLSCTPFLRRYILDILSCAPATACLMYNVLVIYIINTDEMNACPPPTKKSHNLYIKIR